MVCMIACQAELDRRQLQVLGAEAAASESRERATQLEKAILVLQASLEAKNRPQHTHARAAGQADGSGDTFGSGSGHGNGGMRDRDTSAQGIIADIRKQNLFDTDVPADMRPAVDHLRGMCG